MGLIDPVSLRQNSLRLRTVPDLHHLFVGEASVPVVEAVMVPVFVGSVPIVVGNCAETQMLWIDAYRVVAFVHDDFPGRDFADELFIDPSVSVGAFSFLPSAGCNDAVAIGAAVSSPKHAGAHSLYASLNRDWRDDSFVFLKTALSSFLHVAKLAKVAAEGFGGAQQAFLLTLFHGNPLNSGEAMTLP